MQMGDHKHTYRLTKGGPQEIFSKFKKCPKPFQAFWNFLKMVEKAFLASKQLVWSDKNLF